MFPLKKGRGGRLHRTLRYLLIGACLNLILVGLGTAQARSWMHKEGTRWGRTLFDIATRGQSLDSAPRDQQITLNGATLQMKTAVLVGEPRELVETLLKEARSHCGVREDAPLSSFGFTSHQDETEGYAYCLKSGVWDHSTRTEALRIFSDTGDLAALGRFEGIYFRKGKTSLSLLSFRQEGALRPARMFPERGDVPGRDIISVPRPNGRRSLAIGLNGETMLAGYEVEGSVGAATTRYSQALTRAGAVLKVEPQISSRARGLALFAQMPNGEAVLVTGSNREASDGTDLLVTRLPH